MLAPAIRLIPARIAELGLAHNRVAPDKDFFYQKTQNLLSHRDIQHLGS